MSLKNTDSTGSSDSEFCSGLIDLGWMLLEMLDCTMWNFQKIQQCITSCLHYVFIVVFYVCFLFLFTGVSSPFLGWDFFSWNFARFLESRRHNSSGGPWAHLFDKLPNPRHLDGKKWKMWGLRHDKQVSLGFCSREWKVWQDLGCSGHFLRSLLLDIGWSSMDLQLFLLLDPWIFSSHPLDPFIDPSRKNHPSYIQ